MLDLSEISSIVKFIESLSFACSSLGYAMFIIYSFSSIYYITYKKTFNFWSIRNNLIMISQLNVRSGILSTYLSIYKLFPSLFWLKKLFLFISFPFLYYYRMLSHLWCIVYSLFIIVLNISSLIFIWCHSWVYKFIAGLISFWFIVAGAGGIERIKVDRIGMPEG